MDLERLQALAGVKYANSPNACEYSGSNISITGMEKAELMKKHDIQPGTDAWFRLWFSKPYLTGEKPIE
jgi:hypothetical protein